MKEFLLEAEKKQAIEWLKRESVYSVTGPWPDVIGARIPALNLKNGEQVLVSIVKLEAPTNEK